MVQSISPSLYRRRECSPKYKKEENVETDSEWASSSTSLDMGLVLEQLTREKNVVDLRKMFEGTIFKQVLSRCRQVLESDLVVDSASMNAIFNQLVILSEREPYGVRGGILVVMFSPSPREPPVKVGSFPLDTGTVSTFELHLVIQVSTAVADRIKLSFSNLVRKMGGRSTQVMIDPKFSLTKKKLYRSSTGSD